MSGPRYRKRPTGIGAHHHEWLSLVDVSGPFLSVAVLSRVFPQGLDDVPTDLRGRLRLAHEEWRDDQFGLKPDPAIHAAWIRFVFRELLGGEQRDVLEGALLPASLRVSLPQHKEDLAPTFALSSPGDGTQAAKVHLLVQVESPTQEIDKVVPGKVWKASPAARMMALLQGSGVRFGIVTNGATWTLVHAKRGEPTSYATWSSELFFEEPLTLRAFASLFSVQRFIGVQESETLEALFDESAKNQQEVTDQLGLQTRRAVEVLIQTIDRLDRGRRGVLLKGLSESVLYEAAITVMMRLIFLLAAEDRGLLLKGSALWDQGYAVSTLRDQLQERADRMGEEVLERRHDAWARLCATFRAVYAGIEHEDLRLPPYGGSLFEPDRFPFLEGRAPATSWTDPVQAAAAPLAIDDRTVLDLLRSLQELEIAGSGGAERRAVSFRGLDVEQIGHVYEGLLDHTARRATSPTISLAGKNEPEIAIDELERRKKKDGAAFVQWLAEETGRSASTIEKALQYEPDKEAKRRLLLACENRSDLYERASNWAGLIRTDTKDLPVVLNEGAVYVTAGDQRRSTGTHYTPKSLTEPVVRYTLEPLVYEGPAEGKAEAEWVLKEPKEILALRVCDLAMGSGAFLVQACRYLSERLVESWTRAEEKAGHAILIAPDGTLSEGESDEVILPSVRGPALRMTQSVEGRLFDRPASEPPPASERGLPQRLADRQRAKDEERLAMARRFVADRCLYGIDKNPWAVEMAKLSLWLVTLQKDRPFTFLDHALVCGDSLLGLGSIDQLLNFHPDPRRGKEIHRLFAPRKVVEAALKRAREARQKITQMATTTIVVANDKAFLTRDARAATADLALLGDLLMGAALASAGKPKDLDRRVLDSAEDVIRLLPAEVGNVDGELAKAQRSSLRETLDRKARELIELHRGPQHARRVPFHWPLAFPEIADRGGFDAFVGNPPFMGGQKLTGTLGTDYRDYLVGTLAEGRRGSADLCAYFFLRAAQAMRPGGMAGLVATNTIAQGDTREVGLDAIVARQFSIPRAVPSLKWPGDANLEIAVVWIHGAPWLGRFSLASVETPGITTKLVAPGRSTSIPYRLAANAGLSFQGSIVLGMGFTFDDTTPAANSLAEMAKLLARDPRNAERIFPYMGGEELNSSPDQSHRRYVINFGQMTEEEARSWPDLLEIVERRVKPDRIRKGSESRARHWWRFGAPAAALYEALQHVDTALAVARTTKHLSFSRLSKGCVFSENLVVFALPNGAFTLLQSGLHDAWVRATSSTLEDRQGYRPSDCFETFPFPHDLSSLELLGERYHAHRGGLMRQNQEGLTKIYNRLHDPAEDDGGIRALRDLQVEMDQAVLAAYGWTDLPLGHGFRQTKQGVRFTVSEIARLELLDRLLELNHERYTEEVAQGLHEKGAKAETKAKAAAAQTKAKPAKAAKPQLTLFAGGKKDEPKVQPSPVAESARGGLRAASAGEEVTSKAKVALSPHAEALVIAIEEAHTPLGKATLLTASGIPESGWRDAVGELLEKKLVAQEGERRGAVYLRTRKMR